MDRVLISAILLSITTTHPAGAAQTPPSARQVLTLRPAPAQGPAMEFDYRFANTPPPFAKEPALEGKEIARGLIPTVPPTSLIRKITDQESYLKTDHGQEFTTSPLATYKSQCRDGVQVTFDKVRVFSERGPLAIPYTVSITIYRHGYWGRFFVQSGWSGNLALDGRSWWFTIVDDLDDRIDAQDRLSLRDMQTATRMRTHECPVPQVLFVGGHTYAMDYTFWQAGSDVVPEAGMTEVQVPTGQLRLEAKGCRGIVLRKDRHIVLLGGLEGTLSVPAGRYRVDNCLLDHEPNQWRFPEFVECAQEISVQPGQTASLRMGPPLRNAIVVTRDRNPLRLTYRLVGSGDEVYQPGGLRHRPSCRSLSWPLISCSSGSCCWPCSAASTASASPTVW